MQPGKAFLGGVLGGAAMTLITSLGRAVGVQIHLEMWIGSLLTADTGILTWVLGFLVFLGLSGVIGLVYGAAFEHLAHRAGALTGFLLSFAHLLVSGIAIGSLAASHPLIPLEIADPGRFVVNFGPQAVSLFALSHMIFGAVVGAVYEPVLAQNRVAAEARI